MRPSAPRGTDMAGIDTPAGTKKKLPLPYFSPPKWTAPEVMKSSISE